jgi:uncharacterized protein YyaL (SSP411 family)
MLSLIKLSRLTGDTAHEERAIRIGRVFSRRVKEYPGAHTYLLQAVDFLVGPSVEIVIVGKPASEDTKLLLNEVKSRFLPNKVVLFKPSDDKENSLSKLAPFTKDMKSIDGKATAYICRNFACELPTTNVLEMRSTLERLTAPGL